MSETCKVMFKDIVIGKITYRKLDSKRTYTYEIINSEQTEELYLWHRLPIGLFRYNANYPAGITPILPSSEKIEEWLSKRILPSNRQGIESILTEAGMGYFNVWEMNKHTKSMNYEDYFWLKFNDSERYEDIHIRHLLETRQLDKLKEMESKGQLPI